MPEGDALHRVARRLQVLVGEEVEVETPHPRAAVKQLSGRLDGRRLEAVDAVGKNLLLRFEGGVVLRSHLRMTGRWRVLPRDARLLGRPWLVLRGARYQAAQWNGPVLELGTEVERRLGPDILAAPPALEAMVANLRRAGPELLLGEALQRQRLVSGIGNMWMSEALWTARLTPWARLGELADDELRGALDHAHRLMRDALDGRRRNHGVYRRAGRPCRRCGTPVRSRGQGDDNRIAYWCPSCQRPAEAGGSRPAE